MAFLMDIGERGRHVALASVLDPSILARLVSVLTAAGFTVLVKHQPASTAVNWVEGKEGNEN